MLNVLDVARGLRSGEITHEDMYFGCPVEQKTFNEWTHGNICFYIFDDYRANRLLLQFDPFTLLFIDENNLKELLLVKTNTVVSDQYSYTDVNDDDLYVINYPLLTSLDDEVLGFLISKMS